MPSLIQLPRNSTKCPKISGEIVVGRSQAARWISCVEILRSCLFEKIACNDFAIYPSRAAIQELRKRSPVSISTATPAPLQCIGRGCTVPRHLNAGATLSSVSRSSPTTLHAGGRTTYNPNYPDVDYSKIVCLLRGVNRSGNAYPDCSNKHLP